MLFVLIEGGKIFVYSSTGTLKYKISAGADVDQIKVGPRGKVLIFGSRKDKKIKFISLTYIQPNFRSYEGILVVSC
jgi:hypothetical protein